MATYNGLIKFINNRKTAAIVKQTPVGGTSGQLKMVKKDLSSASKGDTISAYSYSTYSSTNEGYNIQ